LKSFFKNYPSAFTTKGSTNLTKMETYSKKYLIECISTHFEKQGKKMTNLSKAPIDTLVKIIKKYNVEVPEINEKEERKKQIAETKRKRQERIEKEMEEEKQRKEKQMKEKNFIADKIKYWNEPKRASIKRGFCESYYRKYYHRTEEQLEKWKIGNIKLKTFIDVQYGVFERDPRTRNIYKVDDETISVNGINISFGSLSPETAYTHEETEKLIAELYEIKFESVIKTMYFKSWCHDKQLLTYFDKENMKIYRCKHIEF